MIQICELFFDGACTPVNPGGYATAGWVLNADGTEIVRGWEVLRNGSGATNNYAEWCGLGKALRAAVDLKLKIELLRIFGDSQLVIWQYNREWGIKAETLRPLFDRCHELTKQLGLTNKQVVATWMRREHNALCDFLSKQAYELRNKYKRYDRINGVDTWTQT